MRVRRIDTSGNEALKQPVRLPNGSWVLEGYATRAGVLRYLNPDGSERLEFRPPEEVEKAAANLSHCVLTHRHPPEGYVTPATAGARQRGVVLDAAWDADSRRVPVRCLVTDQRLLDALSEGTKELSPGYEASVTEEPGEWEGQRYTHVQRDIHHNHLAVVEAGRAGPECAFRLDAEGHVDVEDVPSLPVPAIDTHTVVASNDDTTATPPSPEGNPEEKTMADVKVTIAGKEFLVPEAVAQAIAEEGRSWEAKVKEAQEKATKTEGEVGELKLELDQEKKEGEELEKKLDAADQEKKTLSVRLVAEQEEVKRLKQLHTDAADPVKFQAQVDAKVSLVRQAEKVLGANYDFAKRSTFEVHCDALDKLVEGKEGLKKVVEGFKAAKDTVSVAALYTSEMARFDAGDVTLGGSHGSAPGAPEVGVDFFLGHQQAIIKRQRGEKKA